MTILKERLTEALEAKKNDINSFTWKGKKTIVNGKIVQSEKKLIDCSEEELQKNYNYCKQMLYNTDRLKPGRYVLLEIINDQIKRCNCELFLRYLETVKKQDRFTFTSDLKNVIGVNKDNLDFSKIPISAMANNIPNEFANLPVSLVLEGGVDQLGRFERNHITLTFITKQGVWFTPEELRSLTIKNEKGEVRNRLQVVKEKLMIHNNIPLRITPKGLSFEQLKAMITLKSKKYSDLTDEQLKVLKNRILFSLSDDCCYHIKQWEEHMRQIRLVAENKNYKLID